jgi:hypothetical protein
MTAITPRIFLVLSILSLAAHADGPPRCAVRSGGEGAPAIVVDGQPLSPIMFCGNNQFGRDEVLVEELKLAAENGIPFHVFNLPLAWLDADGNRYEEIVKKFCDAHPEGYFYVRIWLGPNRAWTKANPDECITKDDGSKLNYASPSSALWREATAETLHERVQAVAEGPYGSRFIGACLSYLQTAEWFYPDTNAFMDYSPANLAAFRAWLKDTYRSKRRLRKAWGDAEVEFETAEFPSAQARGAASLGPFRDPASHQSAIDMQRFQSTLMVETIGYFAKVVKKATKGRSLVGTFYGYSMELNNNGPRALSQSGHLAFGQLLRNPDIDLIHAPYSYLERKLGQSGHHHLPLDSAPLHGKLCVIEEDTFTHLAMQPKPGLGAPGWRQRTRSAEETTAITQRNIGNILTHRAGLWYFDLLSDGRWNDAAFWESGPFLRRMAAELRSEPVFRPEIAFVIDEEAVHFVQAKTAPLLHQSLSLWRSEWDRVGAPVGYYLQSDLAAIPASVRLLVLANPYRLSDADRKALAGHYARGTTVLWTYAADIVGEDGPEASRVAAAAEMAVEARLDNTAMAFRSAVTEEEFAVDKQAWHPRFVVTDPDVEVLARYRDSDEVAVAAKPHGNGVTVYTATPRLPVGLLRWICKQSGVHLYRSTPGMTGVAGRYLFVHGEKDESFTLAWPEPIGRVQRVTPSPAAFRLEQNGRWEDALPRGETAIYRILN